MRRYASLTIFLLLLALVLCLLPNSLVNRLRAMAIYPVKAVASLGDDASVRSNPTNPADAMEIQRLRGIIDDLEERVNQLSVNSARVEKDFPLLAARVFLPTDLSSWHQTCYIDAGADQGIAEGMAVADERGLVGIVSAVFGDFSRVALLTDPSTRIRAAVQVDPAARPESAGRERLLGILEADSGDELRLRFIPVGTPVRPGDPVRSADAGGALPRGIPIGTVTSVNPANDGLTLRVTVQPLARLHSVQNVVVFLMTAERRLEEDAAP